MSHMLASPNRAGYLNALAYTLILVMLPLLPLSAVVAAAMLKNTFAVLQLAILMANKLFVFISKLCDWTFRKLFWGWILLDLKTKDFVFKHVSGRAVSEKKKKKKNNVLSN